MEYWHKQSFEPLFPDTLWSRPENRQLAGKLLIAGGNSQEFSAPAIAYQSATKAGVGSARCLVPDVLKRQIGMAQEVALFAPSTPSGSFAKNALGEFITESEWADGVLLAGGFGKNSETAVLIEAFAEKFDGLLTLAEDAVDNFYSQPLSILNRPNTLLIVGLAQLQKLLMQAGSMVPVYLGMNLMQLVEALHNITQNHKIFITTQHQNSLIISAAGQVSTTNLGSNSPNRVDIAATSAVFWLQQPLKPFESLTTAGFTLSPSFIENHKKQ